MEPQYTELTLQPLRVRENDKNNYMEEAKRWHKDMEETDKEIKAEESEEGREGKKKREG